MKKNIKNMYMYHLKLKPLGQYLMSEFYLARLFGWGFNCSFCDFVDKYSNDDILLEYSKTAREKKRKAHLVRK